MTFSSSLEEHKQPLIWIESSDLREDNKTSVSTLVDIPQDLLTSLTMTIMIGANRFFLQDMDIGQAN